MARTPGSGAAKGRCPICGKPPVESFRPFCSKRCANIDLGRWVSGSYAIAGSPDDEEDDTDATAAGLAADNDADGNGSGGDDGGGSGSDGGSGSSD